MLEQQLKTVVTLGGAVDGTFNKVTSSFNESMGKVKQTVRDLESEQKGLSRAIAQSEKAQEQLNRVQKDQYAVQADLTRMEEERKKVTGTINAQRQALSRLDKEQEAAAASESGNLEEIAARRAKLEKVLSGELKNRDKLTEKITKAKAAQRAYVKDSEKLQGSIKDVDELKGSYDKLGHKITVAKRELDGFNGAAKFSKSLKTVVTGGAALTATIWGSGAALTGFMAVTNAATAETAGLAKAYDMSIEGFKAWGGVAKQAGLNAENVGDQIEELSNKYGEFKALGKQSAVSDVFGALGITQSVMEGKTAAEQYEMIMRRLEKVKDKQQAASLADQLFGGEANKMIMYIRNSGKSMDELLAKQRQLNLLTDKGANGATAFGYAYDNLTTVVGSAWEEISGIVGGEFAGDIDSLSEKLAKLVKDNKGEIVDFVHSVVDGTVAFTKSVWDAGKAVNSIVQSIGGWSTVGAVVTGLLAGKMVTSVAGFVVTGFNMVKMLGTAKTVMLGLNMVMAANPVGAVAAAVGLLVTAGIALYQNWDTVKGWFSGTFDWFGEKFAVMGDFAKTVFSFTPIGMVVSNWKPITEFFSGMWDGITKLFDDRIAKIKTVITTVTGWVKKLKFWGDDSKQTVQAAVVNRGRGAVPVADSTSIPSQAQPRVGRGASAIRNAQANRSISIQQSVGDIHVTAAAGQSPQEVAQAIHDKLSAQRNGALYDLPAF